MAEETLIWRKVSDDAIDSSDDGNAWDDTALVKAYDKAIAQLKGEVPPNSSNNQVPESKQKRKKKKKKKNKSSDKKWQEGLKCLAVFKADGLYYEGKILELNHEKRTALIEYVYYLNQDEVSFDDLLPIENIADMEVVTVESASNYSEDEKLNTNESISKRELVEGWRISDICFILNDAKGTFEKAVINSFTSPGYCCITLIKTNQKKDIKISQLHSKLPTAQEQASHCKSASSSYNGKRFAPLHPDSHMHVPPPPPPFVGLSQLPSFPFGNDFSNISREHGNIYPGNSLANAKLPTFPPPPIINTGVISGDEEALANMLMSWYMSGYHTGFYQGMQQKKQSKGRKRQSKGKRWFRDDTSN